MNQKEIIGGLLFLVLLYLLLMKPVEAFSGGGEMPLGQLMRQFVEHGSTPLFYR